MAVRDHDFYNVLGNIATYLKKISESLDSMQESRKRETEQFLKESKMRMRKETRTLLTEEQKRRLADNAARLLTESRLNPKSSVNKGN